MVNPVNRTHSPTSLVYVFCSIAAMLQDAISSVDDYEFEIENALARQLGAKPLPFPGMDSKNEQNHGLQQPHVS